AVGLARAVDPVEQGVRSRTQFVDAGLVREVARRRRAARDAVAADAGVAERVPRLAHQRIGGGEACPDRLGVAAGMTRIAAYAGHLDGRKARELLREIERAG